MICLVLPAYNEELSIDNLFQKIENVMKQNNYEYKIVFVNDGSKDKTGQVLAKYIHTMNFDIVNHKTNRGLWETIRDGFERAAEICKPDDIIIRMDCDDSHDPKYIPSMIAKLQEGYDVVITSRFQPGGGSLGVNSYRNFISRCANLVMKLFFPIKGVWEYSCGYRAYRALLVQDALRIYQNAFIDLRGVGFTCTLEKLIKFRMMKARIGEVPFQLRYDLKRSSSKMVSSITTIGYIVLILKYIYPWGDTAKHWIKEVSILNNGQKHWRGY